MYAAPRHTDASPFEFALKYSKKQHKEEFIDIPEGFSKLFPSFHLSLRYFHNCRSSR